MPRLVHVVLTENEAKAAARALEQLRDFYETEGIRDTVRQRRGVDDAAQAERKIDAALAGDTQ